MDENKFSYLLIDNPKEDYSNIYEKNYQNNEFNGQKYEKFKAKEKANEYGTKILEKRENQVKNLLSIYLKNIESDYKNSDPISKNKQFLKNQYQGSSKIKNAIIKTPKEKKNNKVKIVEKTNPNNYLPYKEGNNFSKKKSNLTFEKNFQTDRTSKFKEKLNNIIKKTKSFGNKIRRKFKSEDIEVNKKSDRKGNNINKINNNLIKKHISFNLDNNSLNFKNDNSILYKNSKSKSSCFKQQQKKKENILEMFKSQKKNILNDSNHNSILSDFSDYHLNKKSFDIKNYDIDNISNKYTISKMSSQNQKSSIKTNISNLKLRSQNIASSFIKCSKISLNPKSISELEKLINNQKETIRKSNFKRAETTNIEQKIKSLNNSKLHRLNTQFNNSKFHRLNRRFKSLKEQLKKNIFLHPENLKKSPGSIKNKINNENNNIFSGNLKKNNSLVNNKNNKLANSQDSYFNENKNKINTFGKNSDLGLASNSIKNELTKNNVNQPIENRISNESIKIINKNSKDSLKNNSITKDLKTKMIPNIEKYRILIHKSNVYDSLDDEELEDQEEINNLYIDPNSSFTFIFDSVIFFINFLSFFEIPLYLAMNFDFCMEENITFFFALNFLIEFLNIIDLILGFFRAYYNWDEQIIVKYKMLITKYLSTWFIFDLISSIPFYTINKFCEKKCNNKELSKKYFIAIQNNLDYLFVSNRLIKLFKIFNYNQAWNYISNKFNENFRIIIYIILVFASINYTACIYIFIGRNSYPNWILTTKLDTNSFVNIYISAIYVITMTLTTVGYGDITCYSLKERIFQLFILIIGIIVYSWVVSIFSSFIKKINEKSADFEKKLLIIDDIKRNNPNLPDDLYFRIINHLKFKNIYEKKLKNIIFDCLPVGLKNELISEMYKPIITKFIFFKNFQNTDFIVRVILAFKPIIAYKNDILVNKGDMVEDIMFVKKGVLALELPINIDNPRENYDKYLKTSLTMQKNDTIESLEKTKMNPINSGVKTTINQGKNSRFNNLLSTINTNDFNKFNYIYSFNKQKEKEKTEIIPKKNIIYVKILWIRENEHFGDVLMFLEQRSPLRVRVRSKKCELFFLKKVDAIKISNMHQNLWKRINKKSVFNFEQIKKNIEKIVEVYCSAKKYKSKIKNEFNKEKNESEEKSNKIKYKFNNSFSNNKKKRSQLRKSKSLKNYNIIDYSQFFKKFQTEDIIINNVNNKNKKKFKSMKNLANLCLLNNYKKPLVLSSSSSSSFFSSSPLSSYSYSDKINSKIDSKNNSINKKQKNKKKIVSFKLNDNNKSLIDEEEKKIENAIKKTKIVSSNNLKLNNMKNDKNLKKYSFSSNYEIIKDSENEINSSYSNTNINEELKPGEFFKINKEENLLKVYLLKIMGKFIFS